MDESSKQVRVMLWCPPRSLSTVFEKCLSYVDDIQIVNEPYNSASLNNPEMMKTMTDTPGFKAKVEQYLAEAEQVQLNENIADVGWDDKICTPVWVKHLLEGDFPGKKVIFAKDLLNGIKAQFHMVPKGYRHTFIIRNPTKMLISQRKVWMKMIAVSGDQLSLMMIPPIFRDVYQTMLELIDFVKDNEGETNPIIIDADDLQNNPGSIVRQYCEALGIPYKESLLEWPAGDGCVKKSWLVSKLFLQGDQLTGYYAAAFASTKFEPSKPLPPENEITADVLELAKREEPYYRKLYDLRIKP